MNQTELEHFVHYYYEDGSPERAAEALAASLTPSVIAGGGHIIPYFYGRIAWDNPHVLREYEELFAGEQTTHEGRLIVLETLRHSGDDGTRRFLEACLASESFKAERDEIDAALRGPIPMEPDALTLQISSGIELDILWSEFFFSGERTPIRRIIKVLGWPDRVRTLLEQWLRSDDLTRRLIRIFRPKHPAIGGLSSVGIVCDEESGEVETADDLDCLSALEYGEVTKERFDRVRRALPFRLSSHDQLYIGTKACARWSLAANALNHSRVLETCEAELQARTGRSRLALLDVTARVHLHSGEYPIAAARCEEHLELNPHGAEVRAMLADLEGQMRSDALRERIGGGDASRMPVGGASGTPSRFKLFLWGIRNRALYAIWWLRGLVHALLFPPSGLTEAKLDSLTSLSADGSEVQGSADWGPIVAESVELTANASAYCSRTIHYDFVSEDRRAEGFIVGRWRMDYVRPDKYHVTQEIYDSELGWLADKWVSIGDVQYTNAGLWFRSDDLGPKPLNNALTSNEILEVLRSAEPTSSRVCQSEGQRYLLLEYTAPQLGSSDGFSYVRYFHEVSESLADGDYRIRVWINLESRLVVKGHLILRGEAKKDTLVHEELGEKVHLEIQQIFTSYNERINVERPPWLNVIDGVVVGASVPILRHHP